MKTKAYGADLTSEQLAIIDRYRARVGAPTLEDMAFFNRSSLGAGSPDPSDQCNRVTDNSEANSN